MSIENDINTWLGCIERDLIFLEKLIEKIWFHESENSELHRSQSDHLVKKIGKIWSFGVFNRSLFRHMSIHSKEMTKGYLEKAHKILLNIINDHVQEMEKLIPLLKDFDINVGIEVTMKH